MCVCAAARVACVIALCVWRTAFRQYAVLIDRTPRTCQKGPARSGHCTSHCTVTVLRPVPLAARDAIPKPNSNRIQQHALVRLHIRLRRAPKLVHCAEPHNSAVWLPRPTHARHGITGQAEPIPTLKRPFAAGLLCLGGTDLTTATPNQGNRPCFLTRPLPNVVSFGHQISFYAFRPSHVRRPVL